MKLRPLPLDSQAFHPYGEVIEHMGESSRRKMLVPFELQRADIRFGMTVNLLEHCRSAAIDVDMFERHPHSPQTFIPLSATRNLIVVALSTPDGAMDIATLRAFIAGPGQGVAYRLAVWHYAFTSIDASAEVAVILGRTGNNDDTEYTKLETPVEVLLDGSRSVLV